MITALFAIGIGPRVLLKPPAANQGKGPKWLISGPVWEGTDHAEDAGAPTPSLKDRLPLTL